VQGGGRSARRIRPTQKVKEAEQSQRVATLVRKSIKLEKSQKKLQHEKLRSLMAKIG
jgi:hypothetical protein